MLTSNKSFEEWVAVNRRLSFAIDLCSIQKMILSSNGRLPTVHRSRFTLPLLLNSGSLMSGWFLTTASVLALLLSGCTDTDPSNDPLGPDESPSTSLGPGQIDEHAALERLTRTVAIAMQDAGLCERVRVDLWRSRHSAEHKLPLSDYLQGENGGILLAKMARESGMSRDEITNLLASVRPLEFYMPNPNHRAEWTGKQEVVVGSQLEEQDDDCGIDYIRPRLSTGEWTNIPEDPKDAFDDGTSDLKWYGYGLDVTS